MNPRALAHMLKNPDFDSRFHQNFPWEASLEAFSEVIFYKYIGRTDKLTTAAGLSYGMGIAVTGAKLFDL